MQKWLNESVEYQIERLLYSSSLLPFFHIPLLHPCLHYCGADAVSIATGQELGVGAEDGRERERLSVFYKPPQPFPSPPLPSFLLFVLHSVYS